jgi:hypothetical protein
VALRVLVALCICLFGARVARAAEAPPADSSSDVPQGYHSPRSALRHFEIGVVSGDLDIAIRAMDLSEVPPGVRDEIGERLALQLALILERVPRMEVPEKFDGSVLILVSTTSGDVTLRDHPGANGDRNWKFCANTTRCTPAIFRQLIGRPPLPESLANMEQRLGVTLIERNPRKVLVTAEGAHLLPLAKQAVAAVDAFRTAALPDSPAPKRNASPIANALDQSAIGNGPMYLGAANVSGVTAHGTYAASTLSPGSDNVYRLGGGLGTLTVDYSGNASSAGALSGSAKLLLGQQSQWGVGTVQSNDLHTYTGGTIVNRATNFIVNQTPTATSGPLGASGTVDVFGQRVDSERSAEKVKGRIGLMPQGLGQNLYGELSVDENVDFFARLRL